MPCVCIDSTKKKPLPHWLTQGIVVSVDWLFKRQNLPLTPGGTRVSLYGHFGADFSCQRCETTWVGLLQGG
jgi:hypothetical protein